MSGSYQDDYLMCQVKAIAARSHSLLASPATILALAQLTNEEAAQHQDAAHSAAMRLRALEGS